MSRTTLEQITTQRLVLRSFREEDAPSVFDACKNPILGHNAGWPPHQTIDDSLFYITQIAPLGYVWAITLKGDDRVIGSIGLLADSRTPEDASVMMLGYWLAQEHWNHGYTTEAAKAVVAWGLSKAGLKRITTCHFLFNDASRRVIEKCGFTKGEIAPFPSDDPDEPDYESQWYELDTTD